MQRGGTRVRVDLFRWMEAKSPYQSVIFDRPENRLITVYHERWAYTDRPIGNDPNPGAFLKADLKLVPQGTDTVANTRCTVWKVDAPGKKNDRDTACITDSRFAWHPISRPWHR